MKLLNGKFFYFYIFFCVVFHSCKTKDLNYITYYNEVYNIDSIYRYKNDTIAALNLYKKLFRKYPPKNRDKLEEYETYITISDKYHKNFGGKKSLYKLIPLVAPYWKYRKQDSDFIKLYKKYGIDSIQIEEKVAEWKKSLNKQLVDSFSIAFYRNSSVRTAEIIEKNSISKADKKNAELLLWTFKNFGYPSKQKIGLYGNNDIFMPMDNLLNHMSDTEHYPYFKTKILEYVKSGDCPVTDYLEMVERYTSRHKLESEYGMKGDINDTVKINRNRKLVGWPSYKHSNRIIKDYWNNEKKKK